MFLLLKIFVGIQTISTISCVSNATHSNDINDLNVLLIIIDDLRILDEENIVLPNIAKLAANGVQFTQAYAQQALCAPSRNSMLTGRRPDTIQLYDTGNYWRDTVGNFTTLPQFYKESGYTTVSLGKVFHPGRSSNYTDDYPYSWSQRPYHPPSQKYKDAPVCTDTSGRHSNLVCPIDIDDMPGKTLPDLETLERAKITLEQFKSSGEPFFMAVGFQKPHIPLKFPRKYLDMVPKTVKLPKQRTKPARLPLVSWHPWNDVKTRDDIKHLNLTTYSTMPDDWALKIKRSYIAASLYVDDLVGQLLARVDYRHTVVVLTSDHGWSLGENGLWAKYSNFDVTLRVPLIFKSPHLKPKTMSMPVELIDIFPTLLELTGHNIMTCRTRDKRPLCLEGKSLVPYLNQHIKHADSLSQYPRPAMYPRIDSDEPKRKDIAVMGYSLRTRKYRYTEWFRVDIDNYTVHWDSSTYSAELYDHDNDPMEADNLYYYLDYDKKLVDRMRLLLIRKINHTNNV